jgi:hypothetical protein
MLADTNGASRSKRMSARLTQVGVGLSASAMVAAGACIPDLPQDQTVPPPPAHVGTCGDGYIDLAAGEECDPGVPDAASLGCSDRCKVTCSGLKWALNDHCYEVMSATAGSLQGEASSRCANFRGAGHVVTYASERELDAVSRYLTDADAGPYWVGLWQAPERFNSVNAYEPGWSPTCPGCYAHTPDPKTALPNSPEAIADPMAAGCVKASPDSTKGSWVQYPCSGAGPLGVVCEHEPEGVHSTTCEAGTCIALVATYATKTYVYESPPLAWTDAETHCHSLGGTLVVLDSRDEREQLWRELSLLRVSPMRIWIGLAPVTSPDESDASIWTWDDGADAASRPSPWGIGQPARPAPAFLLHAPTQPPVDDTLARADPTIRTLPYVCQVPASAGEEAGRD